MSETNRRGGPGAGAAVVAEQPLMLVRYRAGVISQSAGTVHLVPVPGGREASGVLALCGVTMCREELEMVGHCTGVPCSACLASRAIAMGSSGAGCESRACENVGGPVYSAWGWPVTQVRDLIQLSLDSDASAIAIPIPLCTEVTRILLTRHCAPAVLAHPYAPEHHMVLAGERFGAALPWPSGVYQVTGSVMLPPTMTVDGPITWVNPPSKDSLLLSREIDVFGAVRTVIGE